MCLFHISRRSIVQVSLLHNTGASSDYDSSNYDWSSYFEDDEHRLDVYDTLDELRDNIPEELYESIVKYISGEDVEILDI
jgi:EXLDI family protein